MSEASNALTDARQRDCVAVVAVTAGYTRLPGLSLPSGTPRRSSSPSAARPCVECKVKARERRESRGKRVERKRWRKRQPSILHQWTLLPSPTFVLRLSAAVQEDSRRQAAAPHSKRPQPWPCFRPQRSVRAKRRKSRGDCIIERAGVFRHHPIGAERQLPRRSPLRHRRPKPALAKYLCCAAASGETVAERCL